jgi:glycine C-acetyltransferase
MYTIREELISRLQELETAGLYKKERVLSDRQNVRVRVQGGAPVLNMCANNYLGLAQHPAIAQAAKTGIDTWGYGMASVRFICGTQAPHKELEKN